MKPAFRSLPRERAQLDAPAQVRDTRIDDLDACLRPGRFVDSDAPAVRAFAARVTSGARDPRERAVALYYAVRDGFRYDPYSASREPEAYRASHVVGTKAAFCVPKAILLAASARAAGIPARVGFADVRNHLASEKLRARMGGSDLFVFHGYTELHLSGTFVKATPAFDRGLCERFGVRPLEFDGTADALLHPFDAAGRRHMEYVRERGSYLDLPFEAMLEAFREAYPEAVFAAPATPVRDEAFHVD
jgi:transglutaminase-like putative cysteine protease